MAALCARRLPLHLPPRARFYNFLAGQSRARARALFAERRRTLAPRPARDLSASRESNEKRKCERKSFRPPPPHSKRPPEIPVARFIVDRGATTHARRAICRPSGEIRIGKKTRGGSVRRADLSPARLFSSRFSISNLREHLRECSTRALSIFLYLSICLSVFRLSVRLFERDEGLRYDFLTKDDGAGISILR